LGDFFARAFFIELGWPDDVGPAKGCWAKLCPGPPATPCVGELPFELGLTFFGPVLDMLLSCYSHVFLSGRGVGYEAVTGQRGQQGRQRGVTAP